MANNVIPFGVGAIKRLRRSPGSAATVTNPRRSNGFNAAVNVVRSIASKDATAAIAGGSGRFNDISNENCPFVRSSDRSASSNVELGLVPRAAHEGRDNGREPGALSHEELVGDLT